MVHRGVEKVSGHTHLYRRGARYYYRCRVPHDLVAVLGKQEVKFSLNTADRREALVRVREAAVEVDQTISNPKKFGRPPALKRPPGA